MLWMAALRYEVATLSLPRPTLADATVSNASVEKATALVSASCAKVSTVAESPAAYVLFKRRAYAASSWFSRDDSKLFKPKKKSLRDTATAAAAAVPPPPLNGLHVSAAFAVLEICANGSFNAL